MFLFIASHSNLYTFSYLINYSFSCDNKSYVFYDSCCVSARMDWIVFS